MKRKYIILLLLFSFMITLVTRFDFSQIDAKAIAYGSFQNVTNIKPDISASVINPSQIAIITYSDISTNFDINDCSYESTGVDVISMTQNYDVLEFRVRPTINEGFGELKIHIEGESGVLEDTVYLYNTGDKTFFDKISKYQAWYSAMLDLYEQNTEDNIVISEAEICDRYSAFTSPLLEGVPTVTNNETDTVTFVGHIDWEIDDTPVYNKPTLYMRNALIEIGVKNLLGFNKIATGYTDENGNYEIVINSEDWVDSKDIYFRICLEGKTFEVSTFWFFPHYYYEYNLGKIATIGSTVNYNVVIKCETDEDIYKATYVHQAMTISERFAEKMGFESDNFIRVAFPAESGEYYVPSIKDTISLSDMAFCYGDFWGNCICAIGINSWYKTESIVHEYSHYIQCSMGNYGEEFWEILIENPNHNGESDCYAQKEDKSFAMHLSWTEGWGYAFSVMAQKYYERDYGGLKNYETDISDSGYFIGEFQEKSVKAFLWSLADEDAMDYKIDTTDAILDYQLPWTPQEWWNMTTVQGTYRLPDFIGLIESEGYNLGVELDYKAIKEVVAEKLTKFNIAPKITEIITSGPNQAPEIKWMPNGSPEIGIDGKPNSNNRFYVNVLDSEKNVIYRSQELKNLDEFTHQIPTDVWNNIIFEMECLDKVYITIEGYRHDIDENGNEYISGPYYSEYYPYGKNSGHDCYYESINSSSHKYTCNTCSLEYEYNHTLSGKHTGSFIHNECCKFCNYEASVGCTVILVCKNDDTHERKCTVCDYVYSGDHNKICNSINYLKHTYSCSICDYSKTEPHNFEYTDYHIRTCSDCGYILTEGHDFIYTQLNGASHLEICTQCGYSSSTAHDMWYIGVDGGHHGHKCRDCGYVDESSVEPHVYDQWVSKNTTVHENMCECGQKGGITRNHAFRSSGQLLICVDCYYTTRVGSDFGQVILSTPRVSLNGSYITADGTIILVDEDIEAYLNGTLVFYDKNNLSVTQ